VETSVIDFLEADRQQWLKEHLAQAAGRDTLSASRYLLAQTFARLARLRRAGTVDAVLRHDFETLRLACDDELTVMARARGSAKLHIWVPREELGPIESSTKAPSWPCSGSAALVLFDLSPVEAAPHAEAR
jgi:hypothetical protein